MTKPKITIVVPCYNAESTLTITLNSLLQQTMTDIQIIVIDDASTDASDQVISIFQHKDKRVLCVNNERNIGVANTKNLGIALAQGKYIGFLDADDWVHPDFLKNLHHDIEVFDVDFVRCDHIRVNRYDRIVEEAPQTQKFTKLIPRDSIGPVSKKTMLDYPYAGTGLIRTDVLNKLDIRFQENLRSAEDRLFFLRLFYEASSYCVTTENGYFYRKEATNTLTTNGSLSQLDIFKAIKAMLGYCQQNVGEYQIQAKVTEMSLALIDFHAKNRSRLTKEVDARFDVEIKSIWTFFDPNTLQRVLNTSPPSRKRTLKRLLRN